MLLSKQIADLAVELCEEAANRKYVKALIPQLPRIGYFGQSYWRWSKSFCTATTSSSSIVAT